MQDFDPVGLTARVTMLEKVIFGSDSPDYVTQPTAENPFPPIKQRQAKNPDGSPMTDKFGQPIMVDILIHKPGLLDTTHHREDRIKPAGEGGSTSPDAHLAHQGEQDDSGDDDTKAKRRRG